MDFANRGNRPLQQQAPQQQDQQPPAFQPPSSVVKKKRTRLDISKIGSIGMLAASTLLVVFLILGMILIKDNQASESALINTNKYQAVFLNSQDGQVYFGKLSIYNKSVYRLTDIFYVRVEQPIQPEGQKAKTNNTNISLAKLGNELHGPEDEMFIAKDKVLYWENLKDDGQVVTAIKKFIESGRKVEDAASSTNQTQQTTGTQQNQEESSESSEQTRQ